MTRSNRSKVSRASSRNVTCRVLPAPAILANGINGRAMEAARAELAEEAKLKRIARGYMGKWFADDREGYPTDAAMAEAFAGCAKRPERSFYPAIRAAILDEAECMGIVLVPPAAAGEGAA